MSQTTPHLERILNVASEALRLLVVDTDELDIEIIPQTPLGVVLRVRANKQQMGKVIGAQGRTARSLRVLLAAMSAPLKVRISLDIVTKTSE